MKPEYGTSNLSSEHLHIQNIQHEQVKHMFTKHVQRAIFENREPGTSKGLLLDYTEMLKMFGLHGSIMKTTTIKDILLSEIISAYMV